jgi:hypothetical protein
MATGYHRHPSASPGPAPVPGIPTGSTGLGLETNPMIRTGAEGQTGNAEAQSSPECADTD